MAARWWSSAGGLPEYLGKVAELGGGAVSPLPAELVDALCSSDKLSLLVEGAPAATASAGAAAAVLRPEYETAAQE